MLLLCVCLCVFLAEAEAPALTGYLKGLNVNPIEILFFGDMIAVPLEE